MVIAFGASITADESGPREWLAARRVGLPTSSIDALLPVSRGSDLSAPPYGPTVLAAGAIGETAPVVALSLVLARNRAPIF